MVVNACEPGWKLLNSERVNIPHNGDAYILTFDLNNERSFADVGQWKELIMSSDTNVYIIIHIEIYLPLICFQLIVKWKNCIGGNESRFASKGLGPVSFILFQAS